MTNQTYELDTTITPTESNSTIRAFLPSDLYLPEWARNKEFFKCMTIVLDYLQNSLKDLSNPKYAIIEQAYKDIGFKYKDIMQVSEESLKAMLVENGFGKILEIFKLSLEQIQTIALYLPLLKIMKGTDVGYRLFLSLFADEFEIETWLDNPQELEEYTFNILFVSWINVGLSSDMLTNFIEFSRSYVYPVLKKVEMGITFKSLSPAVYGWPRLQFDISTTFSEEVVIGDWLPASSNSNLGSKDWRTIAYDGTKFVALSSSGYISTSTNGIDWDPAVYKSNLNDNMWRSLFYDGTKFIALGREGYISTSTNGIDWDAAVYKSNLGANYWTALSYNGTKFVALGIEGYISTSIDGIDWAEASQNSNLDNNDWTALSYNGTKFVALSDSGYISISINGIDWTEAVQKSTLSLNYHWKALSYDGTKFVALSSSGYISTSTNGIDWDPAVYKSNLGNRIWNILVCNELNSIAISQTGYISTCEIKIE